MLASNKKSSIAVRFSALALGLAGLGLAAGCANLERSRDLNNPKVSATVMAQQVCSNCHGITGDAPSANFPRLAGQTETYLVNQLKGFRSHNRTDPAGNEYMFGLSRHLTDEQIEGLAKYYAQQTPKAMPRSASPELLALGKKIFEDGIADQNVIACASCHGPKGQGMDAFPRLAGQHAEYIVKQLDVFQFTQGRPGTPMEMVTHPLTGSHKEAVAAYLQSLSD